jgi:hypothetical protein
MIVHIHVNQAVRDVEALVAQLLTISEAAEVWVHVVDMILILCRLITGNKTT